MNVIVLKVQNAFRLDKVNNKLFILLISDTRETGFVNAITAAGVTYAITRACTAGALLECSCEKVMIYDPRLVCFTALQLFFFLNQLTLRYFSGSTQTTSWKGYAGGPSSCPGGDGAVAMGRLQ